MVVIRKNLPIKRQEAEKLAFRNKTLNNAFLSRVLADFTEKKRFDFLFFYFKLQAHL